MRQPLRHRFDISLVVLVGELLDNAFHCNVHCLPSELHLHFPRLAVQQLLQFLIRIIAQLLVAIEEARLHDIRPIHCLIQFRQLQ
jgi:hypothetical protein